MEKFFIFTIVTFFIGVIFFLPSLNISTVSDLSLSDDPNIYAGEGETCETPYSKIECEEELECVLVSTKPHKNGVCLAKGTELEEDFINRG